ncbi:MAG: hypothetical protein Q8O28_04815 [Smithellaceae bacterium]|nr:hypothetical protein [Smithellaceae bacterium]
MKRLALVLILLLPIVACGWNYQCTKYTSYNLGEENVAAVGSEMVQTGCFAARYDPTGLNRDLWKRSSYNDSSFVQLIDRELRYAGREGDVLHITNREYSPFTTDRTYSVGLTRTPFFQQVYYDLKTSDKIVFQDWVIKVLDANNQQIRFKVVKEPPQPKIPPPLM